MHVYNLKLYYFLALWLLNIDKGLNKTTFNFTDIASDVTCENGICRPTVAGPSNACMYICGSISCAQ